MPGMRLARSGGGVSLSNVTDITTSTHHAPARILRISRFRWTYQIASDEGWWTRPRPHMSRARALRKCNEMLVNLGYGQVKWLKNPSNLSIANQWPGHP